MMTVEERFWDKVHCEPNTGCWLWAGSTVGKGYGSFWYAGKSARAHRASYEMHIGPIPAGMFVLHTCDVRLCVNPDHLYPGTHADNMRDAHARQRFHRGERLYNSKLTEGAVREIREIGGRASQSTLAARYGVSKQVVAAVLHHKIWIHVLPLRTYDYCELPGDDDGE